MKQWHVKITYSDGTVQDEWFARKSGQLDYVDYIHRMCPSAKTETYLNRKVKVRVKNNEK